MTTDTQRPEPSDWLFDGSDPAADLPAAEAERIAQLSIEFDEPICTSLPDSAEAAVTELFRGFFAHTPYRRIASIERIDDTTLAVRIEHREHADDADGWVPAVHDRTIEGLQATLIDFFGPLWRICRHRAVDTNRDHEPGTVSIQRVEGRAFHYPADRRPTDE